MEPFKRGHRVSVQMSRPVPGHLHNIRVESGSQRTLDSSYSSIDTSNDSSTDSSNGSSNDSSVDTSGGGKNGETGGDTGGGKNGETGGGTGGHLKRRAHLLLTTRRVLRARTTPVIESSKPPTHRAMIKAHLKEQMGDDLFVGLDRKRRVVPECRIPSNNSDDNNVSLEEKVDCVVSDPKFGMFSFFYYHWKTGRNNKQLTDRNVVYCSHIFSYWSALPIMVFISQWTMYIALVIYIYEHTDNTVCPNESPLDQKLLLFGISILYYVKSFGMWDNVVDRSRRKRMIPSNSYIVIIDSLQEYGFNLLVYLANLWIVYYETSLINMLLDSLALEYLMILDNQFKEMYFSYLPMAANDIFDNEFVTYSQNKVLIKDKEEKSCCFRNFRRCTYIPFKLLQIGLLFFPLLCLSVGIYGIFCK